MPCDFATVLEHTYLLLSHVHPKTNHEKTSTCLLCRHRYGAPLQKSPTFLHFAFSKKFPSENELAATNCFRPKLCTYLLRSDLLRAQFKLTCSQLHFEQVSAPRAKNVLIAMDNFDALQSYDLRVLSRHAWNDCERVVVIGVHPHARLWYDFVEKIRTDLGNNRYTEFALFLHFGTCRNLKNFLSWVRESGGRISPRALVHRQYNSFTLWSRDRQNSAWDKPFFV